ncbi:hypothetical protein P350_09860 [Burkholderia cepacia JBK9]|uniref:hypothetical protein n=1 Tax=Burkholderia arboris TaxID=488730 RepID=UPI000740C12A|nr:hypothetical protein [Burkholderia arboris]ALX11830.1 hypothetical protein P350_09860 [Burkholderia cepacia JBK9]MCA8495637.1 hypothetical protein [Burkholderia arboris]
MTVAARPTDASRPRGVGAAERGRPRIVALAVAVSVSIHLLGWFVLQRGATATGPKAAARPRVALRVELIPARPAPEAIVRDAVLPTRPSASAAAARSAARSPQGEPGVLSVQRGMGVGASANRSDHHQAVTAGPEIDWRRDLGAIGARHATARSPAQAAVGALGASSGDLAPRSRTVDELLAGGMSDARRADCRNAHASAGLLALPMLALDAVRDTGCKW